MAPRTAAAAAPAGSTELDRLAALAAYDIIGAAPDDPDRRSLDAVCELAAHLAGAPTAVLNLLDEAYQHQVAAFGLDPAPCRRDESMCQTTLAAGHDICVSDAGQDGRYATSPWVDGRLASIRYYCSIILRTPEGHAVGTLCVFDERAHEESESTVHALRLLAGQAVDVLELRLRTRQLQASNAELSRSQDRLAAFAGEVSHDLKAPITAILGFAELLSDLDAVLDDPSASAYVARCSSAARRMLGMIDDLLAFARVGGVMNPRPVSLDVVMREVLDDLGPVAQGADVSWDGPDVVADPVQLHALLQNLVGNALTYRTDDGPVAVRSERIAESTVVSVVDHGPGIPADHRADVLRPLVRIRKDLPGAGLGLAVCVRVMAAHGGSLRLGDTPGGGLTVTAVFPA